MIRIALHGDAQVSIVIFPRAGVSNKLLNGLLSDLDLPVNQLDPNRISIQCYLKDLKIIKQGKSTFSIERLTKIAMGYVCQATKASYSGTRTIFKDSEGVKLYSEDATGMPSLEPAAAKQVLKNLREALGERQHSNPFAMPQRAVNILEVLMERYSSLAPVSSETPQLN